MHPLLLNHSAPFARRSFSCGMLVFAILCSGFAVGLVSAQYYGGAGDIVFPEPIAPRTAAHDDEFLADDSESPISVGLADRLNLLNSTEEFLQLLEDVPLGNKRPMFTSRLGEGVERSNARIAPPAKCIPELQAVSLNVDNNPSTIIFPPCTRIKQCGGCCNSKLLSCQPTATEMRNFEVIEATIGMKYTGRRIVPLEEHTACKCECRIKEEDCTKKQHYEPHNCTCTCSNIDERDKCVKNNAKFWNSHQCICSCRKIEMCTSGLYFDSNTCRCRPIALPRVTNRYATTKNSMFSNYNFSNSQGQKTVSPVIIPLDPSDPRRKPKEDPERV